MRRGNHIKIPVVEEFSTGYQHYTRITNANLDGRPTKVFLRLLRYGIEKGWFKNSNGKRDDGKIFREILWFGFSAGYINDIFVYRSIVEYALKDLHLRKREFLDELDKEDFEDADETATVGKNRSP